MFLTDGEYSQPEHATADLGTSPPLVEVGPGGRRIVDLYFPLPSVVQDATKLPSFDIYWTLGMNGRALQRRTTFDRRAIQPQVDTWTVYGWDVYGTL
jgi:hypothetical protein